MIHVGDNHLVTAGQTVRYGVFGEAGFRKYRGCHQH